MGDLFTDREPRRDETSDTTEREEEVWDRSEVEESLRKESRRSVGHFSQDRTNCDIKLQEDKRRV